MRAHPRSRGENGYTPGRDIYHFGSSPLTRGKQDERAGDVFAGRLIPAHAGKTRIRRGSVPRRRAHPRSRGENTRPVSDRRATTGSSPLTRGKRPLFSCTNDRGRLIPAHAGKTPSLRRGSVRPRAHPRSRGENGCRGRGRRVLGGSSPLTRGKPERRRRVLRPPGLIPAHAGKTRPATRSSSIWRAHPRSRGENLLVICLAVYYLGSSPLTRGKPAP